MALVSTSAHAARRVPGLPSIMARDEEVTSLEELLSPPSVLAPRRPPGPGLFVGCLVAAVVALAWFPRVIYLFFPLPWTF